MVVDRTARSYDHDVDRNLALLLAAALVLAAIVIVVTSGESVAVRFLVIIVSLDIGARLIRSSRPVRS